ncbi:hypothetical protein F4780DRAFT_199820 [Xylariomycetidae sp. FL0641]|nr:hypothetical protein F4780DRAFT_199820 [Xylariomycetidae sp. FL0641]
MLPGSWSEERSAQVGLKFAEAIQVAESTLRATQTGKPAQVVWQDQSVCRLLARGYSSYSSYSSNYQPKALCRLGINASFLYRDHRQPDERTYIVRAPLETSYLVLLFQTRLSFRCSGSSCHNSLPCSVPAGDRLPCPVPVSPECDPFPGFPP